MDGMGWLVVMKQRAPLPVVWLDSRQLVGRVMAVWERAGYIEKCQ